MVGLTADLSERFAPITLRDTARGDLTIARSGRRYGVAWFEGRTLFFASILGDGALRSGPRELPELAPGSGPLSIQGARGGWYLAYSGASSTGGCCSVYVARVCPSR